MGLSRLPSPSEGMLCVLLVNAALSLSIIKGILRSILRIIGIHLSSSSTSPDSTRSFTDYSESPGEPSSYRKASKIYIEEFRSKIPTVRFDTLSSSERPEYDCPVCRCEFEPESEINLLSCGHTFHKECAEKWLRYLRGTCPLCRTPMVADEEFSSYW
ncbi:putative E3 ubiquitin-protein ligase XERICO [Hibiscus syriacus]|uniref:E3 ubiquitin-protein ligase XERICO n=1 Tax=Hibiscus syriacus TaxID=106335 RepID=A0A6A3AM72_HIBSY|nr:probable E3 ubiquitin-protein ligase XERICO [Hibiscus syriacus]XP_039000781.1 probable E3 ubiquitin-protein ligase XERICO [Hibiscus syriacus]XP_039000782.1 probable E3 ubiquitin-protein ligase XERICO [Hibiscus syriacus]XP_039000783.1 probable E3 ubiquitin-protein ligase XERICO [Hibiscus syriacus]KAE8703942.1 putative E3 ubiquitin-protein ligase XERICO [Hibiscus syriacus]